MVKKYKRTGAHAGRIGSTKLSTLKAGEIAFLFRVAGWTGPKIRTAVWPANVHGILDGR